MTHLNRLPRSTPEQQGISSSAILSFVNAMEASGQTLHSFMLVRRDHVVAEGWWSPYAADRQHIMFSLSKSFTSTAVGLAVGEGHLTVDDYVVSFFPEVAVNAEDRNLAAMRVKHLLSMSSGHAEDTTERVQATPDGDWVGAFLKLPVEHEPGTKFVYNTAATYMLSAIVQRATGETVLDYLQSRLFGPLGIEHPKWEACPRGITVGGYGLSIRTEDIAKFGQLFLHDGIWQGERLLPEVWVAEATSIHVSNGDGGASDWAQGYGYQFWRCRHGAYRGDGAFGQYCVVMPEQEAVIAITSAVDDMQQVLNLIWEHLLPAMGSEPLAEDTPAHAALTTRLEGLKRARPQLNATSSLATEINGRRYVMESNEQGIEEMTFRFEADAVSLGVKPSRGDHLQVRCAIHGWHEQPLSLWGSTMPAAVGGTWRDDSTFIITALFVETPFCLTHVCRFEGKRLSMETSINISMGPKELGSIVGQAL